MILRHSGKLVDAAHPYFLVSTPLAIHEDHQEARYLMGENLKVKFSILS